MIKNLNTIQLKEGDILHCMSNGWLAKLIKFFTKSKINHTAIVLKINYNLFISDAQIKGVYPIPLQDWIKKYNYKYIISRPVNWNERYKNRAINRWGKTSYDFLSLLYQAWYSFTGKWIGKTKEGAKKRMYCSEYVGYIFNFPEWWEMSPANIYEYTKNNTNFVTIPK